MPVYFTLARTQVRSFLEVQLQAYNLTPLPLRFGDGSSRAMSTVTGFSSRIRGPIAYSTKGSGAIAVVSPANSSVAPMVPSALYICPANKGNAAANEVRIVVLHPRALAATGLYATTMYVKEDVKIK